VVEEGGFLYDSDAYNDDLPYWTLVKGKPHLVIPYTLDNNDMKFSVAPGFTSGDGFYQYLKDAFDVLYREGKSAPKMMSIGLHTRLAGRPGRAAALERFLDTDPRDAGCAQAMEMLHVYAKLVATDVNAAGLYPQVAAHLLACGPCAEDLAGLLAAVRKIDSGPIRFLVNTHIHRDHTAGNAFFAKQGAVIFAREISGPVTSLVKKIDAATVKNSSCSMGSFAGDFAPRSRRSSRWRATTRKTT